MRLPTDHHAGQGAGDPVHDLDTGDHQPAQLIKTRRLDPGDDVVGAGEVLGQLHTVQVAKRLGDMGDLADLGQDEHVRAQHPALTSSALDLPIPALTGGAWWVAGRMLHKTGQPAATRPEDLCGIVGAGGMWWPAGRSALPAARGARHSRLAYSSRSCRSRREGPGGPGEEAVSHVG